MARDPLDESLPGSDESYRRKSSSVERGLPIRLTLPHWYGFEPSVAFEGGDLLTAVNWDALRASGEDGFGMPPSADDWRREAERNENLAIRARAILELLRRWRCSKLVSAGVGTGMLEHQIKLASASANLVLRCGDFASATVVALRGYLAGDAVVEKMDLRSPSWASVPDEVVLLHRVDMELDDVEWIRTFEQLAQTGVKHLVIVPCGLLSVMTALRQGKVLIGSLLSRRRLMRNGWVRSPRRLVELFSSWYYVSDLVVGEQFEAWGLTLKSSQ